MVVCWMELSTQKCPARWKIWVGAKSCWLICGTTWFAYVGYYIYINSFSWCFYLKRLTIALEVARLWSN